MASPILTGREKAESPSLRMVISNVQGCPGRAFEIAGLLDMDVGAALVAGLAERIDDVVSGGGAERAAGAVLEPFVRRDGERHVEMPAGSGRQ